MPVTESQAMISAQSSSSRKLKVVICDDHPIVRAGFRQFLSGQPDMESVEEAGSGREALDMVRNDACDVLLLDISMPGQNGVDVLRAIRLRKPELPVLMLSSFPEQHYALQMLKLGASGYLPKDCEPADLLRAIRSVAQGRRFVSESVGDMLANGLGGNSDEPPHAQLSDRELQVFLRLAKGESVTAIANVLNLSFKTISTYRSRVLEKLNLRSNSDVTYYAMKNGLIE
jgi:DNA-binding NarL/FixJ family response regulator